MKPIFLLRLFSVLASGMLAVSALAADTEGSYGIRGAGSQSCQKFIEIVDKEPSEASLFLRWIEGYTTGLNRMVEETFDVNPFVGNQPLSGILVAVCRDEPQMILENAMIRVLAILAPARVESQSDIQQLEYDGNQIATRQETLTKFQQQLSDLGFYNSSIDGLYGPGTRRALIAFQEQAGLETTGLPDAATLIALLINQQDY